MDELALEIEQLPTICMDCRDADPRNTHCIHVAAQIERKIREKREKQKEHEAAIAQAQHDRRVRLIEIYAGQIFPEIWCHVHAQSDFKKRFDYTIDEAINLADAVIEATKPKEPSRE